MVSSCIWNLWSIVVCCFTTFSSKEWNNYSSRLNLFKIGFIICCSFRRNSPRKMSNSCSNFKLSFYMQEHWNESSSSDLGIRSSICYNVISDSTEVGFCLWLWFIDFNVCISWDEWKELVCAFKSGLGLNFGTSIVGRFCSRFESRSS